MLSIHLAYSGIYCTFPQCMWIFIWHSGVRHFKTTGALRSQTRVRHTIKLLNSSQHADENVSSTVILLERKNLVWWCCAEASITITKGLNHRPTWYCMVRTNGGSNLFFCQMFVGVLQFLFDRKPTTNQHRSISQWQKKRQSDENY